MWKDLQIYWSIVNQIRHLQIRMAYGTSPRPEDLRILQSFSSKPGDLLILPYATPLTEDLPVAVTDRMEASYKISLPIRHEDTVDTMVALLMHAGFESFEETTFAINAYCSESLWKPDEILPLSEQLLNLPAGSLTVEKIEPRNYNEEWESRLEPVYIDDFVQIIPRPDFYLEGFEHALHIRPRMSFGTGHHQTTRSVIRLMRHLKWDDKQVWDAGSGTGVLGILALKMGAKHLMGTDIEEWCTENAMENAEKNQVESISEWHTGSTEILTILKPVDVILANLNLNLLKHQASYFRKYLSPKGQLIVSGFYQSDKQAVLDIFEPLRFTEVQSITEENWTAILFQST
jgi:ribosomal protein L11 methyltransferase